MVSQHPAKFGSKRQCISGDVMVLVCHMTSQDHVIKESCDFMGESPLRSVTNLSILVAISTVVVEVCLSLLKSRIKHARLNPILKKYCLFSLYFFCLSFFFFLGFLSRTFRIYRTAGEVGGYFLNSSLTPASQKFRQ